MIGFGMGIRGKRCPIIVSQVVDLSLLHGITDSILAAAICEPFQERCRGERTSDMNSPPRQASRHVPGSGTPKTWRDVAVKLKLLRPVAGQVGGRDADEADVAWREFAEEPLLIGEYPASRRW